MCKKTFSRGTHLRRHMEVCNNQQAMVCLCGKKYKYKEYYNKHVLGCNGLVIDSHENDDEGDPLAKW